MLLVTQFLYNLLSKIANKHDSTVIIEIIKKSVCIMVYYVPTITILIKYYSPKVN